MTVAVQRPENRSDRPRDTDETRIMSDPRFRANAWPTLGVEIELQLVDSRSLALKSAIGEILSDLPAALHDSVKPEFMQCYVEINTGVCNTVDEVEADLAPKIREVERSADRHGVRLVWAATHPFSRWRDQEITPDDRYYKLAALLQETVVRPVTFGLHVHVGVDSGDKAILVAHRIQRFLPIALAMSANSPFWHGRATGHHSHRIEVLEGFPTGGMMPPLKSWAEYQQLLTQMKAAGFVESNRELWWDVRPSAENGTIEIRICDMPADLPDVLGLTAMLQCLVQSLAEEIDRGATEPEPHPLMLRQNRWRACRFGLEAELVDPSTMEAQPARGAAEALIRRLETISNHLGCHRQLRHALEMTVRPSGSERQLLLYREVGELAEVVRRMSGRSRLSAEPAGRPGFGDRAGGWPVTAYRPALPPGIPMT
jgi:glutamate---cysteine ligase / carboxylate-amine ligase